MTDKCQWCDRKHTGGPEFCLLGSVIVCGGRDYNDVRTVFDGLDIIRSRVVISTVRHGACGVDRGKIENGDFSKHIPRLRGADKLADEWCRTRAVTCQRFPADWSKRGNAAGPRRNLAMLNHHTNADLSSCVCLVVAFPGGDGTRHMVRTAMDAMIPVAFFNKTEDDRRYLTIRFPIPEVTDESD